MGSSLRGWNASEAVGSLRAEQRMCMGEGPRVAPSCMLSPVSLRLLCFLKFNILPTPCINEGTAAEPELNGKTKHQ